MCEHEQRFANAIKFDGFKTGMQEAMFKANKRIMEAAKMKTENPWSDKPCTNCGGSIFCRILDGNGNRKTILGDGCVMCGLIRPVPGSEKIEGPGVEKKEPTIEQQSKSPNGRALAQLLKIAENEATPIDQRIAACKVILGK